MEGTSKTAAALALRDHPELFNDFAGIDLASVFADFAKATGLDDKCQACGHTAWSILSAPPSGVTGLRHISVTRGGEEFYLFVPSIITTCATCGLHRTYEMEPMHKWWKEKKRMLGEGEST